MPSLHDQEYTGIYKYQDRIRYRHLLLQSEGDLKEDPTNYASHYSSLDHCAESQTIIYVEYMNPNMTPGYLVEVTQFLSLKSTDDE